MADYLAGIKRKQAEKKLEKVETVEVKTDKIETEESKKVVDASINKPEESIVTKEEPTNKVEASITEVKKPVVKKEETAKPEDETKPEAKETTTEVEKPKKKVTKTAAKAKEKKPGRPKVYEDDRQRVSLNVPTDVYEMMMKAMNCRNIRSKHEYIFHLIERDYEKNKEAYNHEIKLED